MLRPVLTSLRGWAPGVAPACWAPQMLPGRLLQAYSALAASVGKACMHDPAHGPPIVYHEAYSAPQLPPGHRFPMVRAAADTTEHCSAFAPLVYRDLRCGNATLWMHAKHDVPGMRQWSAIEEGTGTALCRDRGCSGGSMRCCWRTASSARARYSADVLRHGSTSLLQTYGRRRVLVHVCG